MAVWQFVVDLIPSSAAKVDGAIAARMSRERLAGFELAFSPSAATAVFERLCLLLPEKQSWSPHRRIWGNEETDDIQITSHGERLEGVQFRLNAAEIRLPLVRGICLLARDLDCVLATQDGIIMRPESEFVLRAIMKSDAARFVKNPERYLREIQLDPDP